MAVFQNISTIFLVFFILYSKKARSLEPVSFGYQPPSLQQVIFPQQFKHPGILLSLEQLNAIENKLISNLEPTRAGFEYLKKNQLARLTYIPKPREKVECGEYSKPNLGCSDEIRDAQAAYTHALIWGTTRKVEHAKKAKEIMEAWSGVLSGGHTKNNAALQASWAAQLWTRAAEILRGTASYSPEMSKLWSLEHHLRFGEFLKKQYLNDINKMTRECRVFNWRASRLEAILNIAILTEDQRLFQSALSEVRYLIKAAIFLQTDQQLLRDLSCRPSSSIEGRWYYPQKYLSGLTQETCRDLAHTAYGLAALFNIAETAFIQGVDLYEEFSDRFMHALEYHSFLENNRIAIQNGENKDFWVCSKFDAATNTMRASYDPFKNSMKGTFEIAYNHYTGQKKKILPETKKFIEKHRLAIGHFHYLWETFTHGAVLHNTSD